MKIIDSNGIEDEMLALRDLEEAKHLMRFFKCGKGDYGEGDRFLGIRVPVTREIVKRCHDRASLEEALRLTRSQWHEVRLAGFLLMIEIYKKARQDSKRHIVDTYLSVLDRGNNWDLVDVIAPKLLGDWLVKNPQEVHILEELADMDGKLWHQRVAIVTNWMLIRNGMYEPTLRIARKFLTHPHDLMHKATGWMLREVGKRQPDALRSFLDLHALDMPRTMLRYAIEKLDEPERRKYLSVRPEPGKQIQIHK